MPPDSTSRAARAAALLALAAYLCLILAVAPHRAAPDPVAEAAAAAPVVADLMTRVARVQAFCLPKADPRTGVLPAGQTRVSGVSAAPAGPLPQASRFGALPGAGAEVNGDVLLVLVPLTWMSPGDPRYADLAGRIADAYVDEVLPGNHGLPS